MIVLQVALVLGGLILAGPIGAAVGLVAAVILEIADAS